MKFYHVDTQGDIEENSTQHLRVHPNDTHPYKFAGANASFMEGVSPWGYGKLWVDLQSEQSRPELILRDWIFELYRREAAIDAPSRFQSLFVCKTIAEAEEFFQHQKPDDREGTIYEIESDEKYGPFYYEWYGGSSLPAEMYWRAENYWNKLPLIHEGGEPGPTEYLLSLPCDIGEEIESVEKDIDQDEAPEQSESD